MKKHRVIYPTENPYFDTKGFELLFTRDVSHLKKLKDTSVIARNGREIIEHWHAQVAAGTFHKVLSGSEIRKMLNGSSIAKRCSVPVTRIFQDNAARLVRQGLMKRVEVDV